MQIEIELKLPSGITLTFPASIDKHGWLLVEKVARMHREYCEAKEALQSVQVQVVPPRGHDEE